MEIFVFIGFFCIFIYLTYSIITKGFRGALFGGKILKTIDDEIKNRKGIIHSKIKVHVIDKTREMENSISIELRQHMYLSGGIMPINLSRTDTLKLISMLEAALKYNE